MKIFYCDGSTRGRNQRGADNIGGWGAVCFDADIEDELESFDYGITEGTTNNREELKALIYCLTTIQELYPDEKCVIYSDSAYVVNIATIWIHSWAKKGWRKADKKPIENLDLVQELYSLLNSFFIVPEINKCEGHCGGVGNELADALATNNIKRFMRLCEEFNIKISNNDYDWLAKQLVESY